MIKLTKKDLEQMVTWYQFIPADEKNDEDKQVFEKLNKILGD